MNTDLKLLKLLQINKIMKTLEKKLLIAKFFELLIFSGYDITFYIGKPLSYYDYDKLEKRVKELEQEQQDQYEN